MQRIDEGLDATKESVVGGEIPDYMARHKYVETVLDLRERIRRPAAVEVKQQQITQVQQVTVYLPALEDAHGNGNGNGSASRIRMETV